MKQCTSLVCWLTFGWLARCDPSIRAAISNACSITRTQEISTQPVPNDLRTRPGLPS
jgi:hypothetical protein